MDRAGLLVIAGAVVAAGYMIALYMADQAPADDSDPDTEPTILEEVMSTVSSAMGLWRAPAQYRPMIIEAEARYSLPDGMLERLLYQESRYRAEIIDGRVRSPVGALGIAQFMPATARDLGIDPLIPAQAIPAAARYLASLYRQTGSWKQALAAYNWGIGNVKRQGLAAAPTETRNYYVSILADVSNSNGVAYV